MNEELRERFAAVIKEPGWALDSFFSDEQEKALLDALVKAAEVWPEDVLAMRPSAHRHLTLVESYTTLVRIFGQVGRAHVAISRSGVSVRGISIEERVHGLLLVLARQPEASPEIEKMIEAPMRILREKHKRMLKDAGVEADVRTTRQGEAVGPEPAGYWDGPVDPFALWESRNRPVEEPIMWEGEEVRGV